MASMTSAIKLLAFIFITLILLPLQIIIRLFASGQAAFVIPRLWHKLVCAIYGIRISAQGTPSQSQHVLFVGNHISYLDIPVISSLMPVRFIAKKDVASWPVFGFLAKLQQTYVIDRSRMAAAQEKAQLSQTIMTGGRFLVFPEGTSSDGSQVLPFKSAAFSMLFDDALTDKPLIQPISVVIKQVNGAPPTTQTQRDVYAWHGDMDLAPHLWALGKQRRVDIAVIFHDSFNIAEGLDRKALAYKCHEVVAAPYNNKNFKVAA